MLIRIKSESENDDSDFAVETPHKKKARLKKEALSNDEE